MQDDDQIKSMPLVYEDVAEKSMLNFSLLEVVIPGEVEASNLSGVRLVAIRGSRAPLY
jgi:hypothetical protein